PRAGKVYRSGIEKTHALERSTARELRKSMRRRGPSLGNCRNPRAGELHHSGNAGFHALESSTARESRNPARWSAPSLRNRRILRAGTSQRPKIAYFRALAPLSYFKNLIYLHSPQKNPLKKRYVIKSSFFRGK